VNVRNILMITADLLKRATGLNYGYTSLSGRPNSKIGMDSISSVRTYEIASDLPSASFEYKVV
jgi:hypothetical protein